jgi:hypothetical protein
VGLAKCRVIDDDDDDDKLYDSLFYFWNVSNQTVSIFLQLTNCGIPWHVFFAFYNSNPLQCCWLYFGCKKCATSG